ncbi:MAG: (d)CMP kinase [Fimbriimonas sp.]
MSYRPNLVIAIDGPAGAGKSTVAKILAKELGIRYLDTGAMYRAVALKASRAGIGSDDAAGVAGLIAGTEIGFGEGDPQPVLLDGEDVTSEIRTLEIGELASSLSVHSEVRRGLVAMQQRLCEQGGVILEGRDTTTVVAPNADVKIYMTASLEERATRRTRELEAKGIPSDFEHVRSQISARDHRDITREDSPLRVDASAHLVETGLLDIGDVVGKVRALLPTE